LVVLSRWARDERRYRKQRTQAQNEITIALHSVAQAYARPFLPPSVALPMTDTNQSQLVGAIASEGYFALQAKSTLELLGGHGSIADWDHFARSFFELEVDNYMADRGRYRRRRHASFFVEGSHVERERHRPHYQGLDYNPVNGGIERWYTPINDAIEHGATLRAILDWCARTFDAVRGGTMRWNVEVHQFRIEASSATKGQPTPEGMHRDGVDYVLVLLVARHNIASGTTIIGDQDGNARGSFTLIEPFDAMMLDDHRVYHGVTAIEPLDPSAAAYRDVLVVTFRAVPGANASA
jgi:hypothetical protein